MLQLLPSFLLGAWVASLPPLFCVHIQTDGLQGFQGAVQRSARGGTEVRVPKPGWRDEHNHRT